MGSELCSTKTFLQTGTPATGKPALDYLIARRQASCPPRRRIGTALRQLLV
jgi:hypothetical protein